MASSKTVILITGSNAGIGYDTAAALANASENNHVIITARSLEKGKKALSELQAKNFPGSLSLVELDVTKQSTIDAAAEKVAAEFGHLDVLVNNAGIAMSASGNHEAPLEEVLATNVIGANQVTEAFVPLLKKSSASRIIYVSSGLGSIGLRLQRDFSFFPVDATPYRVSKAALNMLAACHQINFEKWGCKVFTFCPGYVVTNLSRDRENREKMGLDSSETSARGILRIVNGERDGEIGQFLHRDGVYPW